MTGLPLSPPKTYRCRSDDTTSLFFGLRCFLTYLVDVCFEQHRCSITKHRLDSDQTGLLPRLPITHYSGLFVNTQISLQQNLEFSGVTSPAPHPETASGSDTPNCQCTGTNNNQNIRTCDTQMHRGEQGLSHGHFSIPTPPCQFSLVNFGKG